MKKQLQLTLLQVDIFWEDIVKNLSHVESLLQSIDKQSDIVVLPELFTTGTSIKVDVLAEGADLSIKEIKRWAKTYKIALVGSLIFKEEGEYFNRAFFITPEDGVYYYNKRHLFNAEKDCFTEGNKRTIVEYKDWRINLLICYDLRFPVWSRNLENAYDLIIYVGNWPMSRIFVWDVLLKARALENLSYVCGVNRVGIDGNKLIYNGHSQVFSPKGELLVDLNEKVNCIQSCVLEKSDLDQFRAKFSVWKDADKFEINEES